MSITKDVFSAEQVAKLVAVAQGDWKGVILFGFFTGMRLRDITALRWGNIAEEPQRIEFVAAKTGQEVKIPLHPRLTEFLKLKGKRQPPNIPIFSLLFGKMTGGYSGMSMAFSRIMATAGIEGKKVEATGAKGRARSTLSFHSLRHSFTSALANAGVAQELRQKLTGHRDSKTHQGYTHVELAKLKEAIDLLPTV